MSLATTSSRPKLRVLSNKPQSIVDLICAKQLAEALSISVYTVRKWRAEGRIPCYKLGRAVRYDVHEVVNHLKGAKH